MAELDIRAALGLPPDATDDQVAGLIADIKARALHNVDAPQGWTATAENQTHRVFEGYLKGDILSEHAARIASDFEAEDVTYVQLQAYGAGGTRAVVRVALQKKKAESE